MSPLTARRPPKVRVLGPTMFQPPAGGPNHVNDKKKIGVEAANAPLDSLLSIVLNTTSYELCTASITSDMDCIVLDTTCNELNRMISIWTMLRVGI